MLLKVFDEILFQLVYRDASADGIVEKLVFSDFPDIEVVGKRVRYHESAYGGMWLHHPVFCKMYSYLFHFNQPVQ